MLLTGEPHRDPALAEPSRTVEVIGTSRAHCVVPHIGVHGLFGPLIIYLTLIESIDKNGLAAVSHATLCIG